MLYAYVKSALLVSVFIVSFKPAESINCYQCTSTDTKNPYLCTEFMTGDEDIQPKPCNETYGAKYCIKFTGRDEGNYYNEWIFSLDVSPKQTPKAVQANRLMVERKTSLTPIPDGLKTQRFCSSLDRGTYCVYGNQNGDTLDYRSCWYTCSTDGCNSATKRGASCLNYLITLGLLFKIFIAYFV